MNEIITIIWAVQLGCWGIMMLSAFATHNLRKRGDRLLISIGFIFGSMITAVGNMFAD